MCRRSVRNIGFLVRRMAISVRKTAISVRIIAISVVIVRTPHKKTISHNRLIAS
ncbi:MAG: hypothetical protein KKF57_12595 [Firmicutes bacterium]|nr:hypothetical protein [Bacillota bacterium]